MLHVSLTFLVVATFEQMLLLIHRYGEIHPHFYMGPLTEAIKEAGGASAKEVDICNLTCSLKH